MEGKQFQLLIENIKDRIMGVPGISAEGLLPLEEPGMEMVIVRDAQRTIAEVEKKLKLAVTPKRKTDLARTAREVYESKTKYRKMGAILDDVALHYPRWSDLTAEQKSNYIIDVTLPDNHVYMDGTIPWDLLTKAQKMYFSMRVVIAPNKSGEVEKLDGKSRSYIKLRNREIIKIHTIALEVRDPNFSGTPFLSRTYNEWEYYLYKREGGVQLIPAQAQLGMAAGGSASVATTGYGLSVPSYPQVIKVDYTYGFEELPLDLSNAISMLTAIKVFESVNILQTKGLMGYSVQGFSANFGKGLYTDTMERYADAAESIMTSYRFLNMTGW